MMNPWDEKACLCCQFAHLQFVLAICSFASYVYFPQAQWLQALGRFLAFAAILPTPFFCLFCVFACPGACACVCAHMCVCAGSNLPGIASQFANQILGTANQLRNAEQKSANQKNHLRSGAIDASHKIRGSLRDRNRQHDQPETAGAATAQPGAGPDSRRVVYC